MSVLKKLTKHGNSYSLIIDKPILELIGIDKTTLLEISTPDGESLLLRPIEEENEKEFDQALKEVNRKYSKALKRLAK
ncbi:MAG: hypothetical protein K1060chlam4_01137 [Candidatus Anoxychlamydiales bacterium]|nr:hypothetical protein [Candidatus Anoxychlamydiales bacterium]